MKNIITLTYLDEYNRQSANTHIVYLDACHVISIHRDSSDLFTYLYLTGGSCITVKETPEEISLLHSQFTDLERVLSGKIQS